MKETISTKETVSSTEKVAAGRQSLHNQLDELLERYLHLLNVYQVTRQELSSHFSSGFLSLAQANFNTSSNLSFGQDQYDERMKASRRIIVSNHAETYFRISLECSAKDTALASSTEKVIEPLQKHEQNHSTLAAKDPIRWFGILVPQALRETQKEFIAAVETPIPGLCNVLRQMRSLESEISKIRKQLKKL